MSKKFSPLVKIIALLLMWSLLLPVTSVQADSGAATSGSWHYDMNYVANGEHVVGTIDLEWHQVSTAKADIYRLRYVGDYNVYDMSGNLLRHVTWSEVSHQRSAEGVLIQLKSTSQGSDGTTYEYKTSTVYIDGEWKMSHYWENGILIY